MYVPLSTGTKSGCASAKLGLALARFNLSKLSAMS